VQEVGTSHRSIHTILSDELKTRRVSVKFVPRQLTLDQMECCQEKHVITQPPYSPDLTSSDLAVPYSENGPQGACFAAIEGIKSNVTAELCKIPKEAFHCCFRQWQDRWSKCVCVQGYYLLMSYIHSVNLTTGQRSIQANRVKP
jgi:hypothetical protein